MFSRDKLRRGWTGCGEFLNFLRWCQLSQRAFQRTTHGAPDNASDSMSLHRLMGPDWVWFGSSFQNHNTNMLNRFLYFFLLSVQFSCSVVSNSLWPHGLQHARLLCPLSIPGACLNSCPLSRWCHPTISSSVIPISSRFPSFPASGSFPVSQFFTSVGQSIGASASASVLPMNI